MILHLLEHLNTKRIILASSSARRYEILTNIGLKFTVLPSTFAEDLKKEDFAHPGDYVVATAVAKAEEVRNRIAADNSSSPPDLIISCDTCVVLDGEIYGKPTDDQHATQLITRWSGRTHNVISGVCLLHRLTTGRDWQSVTFQETTSVTFHTLPADVIASYVATHEPRGKAGGYALQGLGGMLVEGINGDFYNVMGFPLHHFCRQMLPLLQTQSNTQS